MLCNKICLVLNQVSFPPLRLELCLRMCIVKCDPWRAEKSHLSHLKTSILVILMPSPSPRLSWALGGTPTNSFALILIKTWGKFLPAHKHRFFLVNKNTYLIVNKQLKFQDMGEWQDLNDAKEVLYIWTVAIF